MSDRITDTVSATLANLAAVLPVGKPRVKRRKDMPARCPRCEMFWHSCSCPQR